MQLRIAAIQPSVTGDLNQNIDEVARLIQSASKKDVDIAVLPELWIHSSPMQKINHLANHSQLIIQKLVSIARKQKVAIIGGGIYLNENDYTRISCPIINENGELLGFQHKLHLIKEERSLIAPGERFDIFKLIGTKIGIAICHDIVYPEYVRILALRGAEIIINPSRIINPGIRPWHLYLLVRSLENRIPIVAPNIWIKGRFNGKSIIVQPVEKNDGIYIPSYRISRNGSTTLIDAIEKEKLKKARIDRLSSRRPEMYNDIIMNNQSED